MTASDYAGPGNVGVHTRERPPGLPGGRFVWLVVAPT